MMRLILAAALTAAVVSAPLAARAQSPQAQAAYAEGLQFKRAKDNKAALGAFSRATQLDPSYAPAWTEAGNSQLALQQPDLAAKSFAKALELDPADLTARYNLAYFSRLPYYRRQWRRSGFIDEMRALKACWQTGDRKAAAALVSERMIEEVCVFGSAAQCREQLDQFREAGAGMPVLAVSPVNEDRFSATKRALELLGGPNGS